MANKGGRKRRELTAYEARKIAAGLCTRLRCNRKLREPGRYDCQKHHKEKQKERDPIGVYFDQLKQRAKTRPFLDGIGIPVTITRAQFRAFCIENGFKGKSSQSGRAKTIDRIRPRDPVGYGVGNLQVITRSANSKKMHVDKALYYAYKRGLAPNPYDLTTEDPNALQGEDLPANLPAIEFPEEEPVDLPF